jgi:NitT/TauT family transport system substrate-binding protein
MRGLRRQIGAAAIVAGALAAVPAVAMDDVVLQINWFHLADHSPYYLGMQRGYYEEEGINLTVLRGYGSSDTTRKMELQQATIGVAETGVVVTAISKGADLTIVGIVFDKPVNGIFSRASAGIRTPKDLEGRSIGAPPGDAHLVLWPAFCAANEIDCSTVTLINIQPEGKQALVASNQADGAFDAYTGLNIWRKALGDDIAYLDWSEWGIGLYGHGYIVHNDTIAENPDLVRRFLRATYRAWADAKADPVASVDAMYGADGVQPFDREVYLANFDLILDRVVAERAAEHGIGWIVPEIMQSTIDLTALGGQMDRELHAEEVFTNEFNPKIFPPQ